MAWAMVCVAREVFLCILLKANMASNVGAKPKALWYSGDDSQQTRVTRYKNKLNTACPYKGLPTHILYKD